MSRRHADRKKSRGTSGSGNICSPVFYSTSNSRPPEPQTKNAALAARRRRGAEPGQLVRAVVRIKHSIRAFSVYKEPYEHFTVCRTEAGGQLQTPAGPLSLGKNPFTSINSTQGRRRRRGVGARLLFATALFSAGSLGEEAEVSITHGKYDSALAEWTMRCE